MTRTVTAVAGGVAILAVLVAIGLYSSRSLAANLPPKEVLASMDAAGDRAAAYVAQHGGRIIPVMGTGSMVPFIPAARNGEDPAATMVAFVVIKDVPFDAVVAGNVCLYAPKWAPALVIHVAAEKDTGGWIMSGINNARSESWERMTAVNFRGVAAQVYTW